MIPRTMELMPPLPPTVGFHLQPCRRLRGVGLQHLRRPVRPIRQQHLHLLQMCNLSCSQCLRASLCTKANHTLGKMKHAFVFLAGDVTLFSLSWAPCLQKECVGAEAIRWLSSILAVHVSMHGSGSARLE